jgi:deoxyribodipyrimidine photo-lyase
VNTVLHWFRQDLRIRDNAALSEAIRRSKAVVPVFILEDSLHNTPGTGAVRLAFLLRSLAALRDSLAEAGLPLIVRRGPAETELVRLARETQAQAVFCNKCPEPAAALRDGRVFAALNAAGVGFEPFKDAVAWEEDEILTQAGKPFTVFTPYSKAWKKRRTPPPLPAPRFGSMTRQARISSVPLPADPAELGHPCAQPVPEAGEAAALRALQAFMRKKVLAYGETRDYPAQDGTSRLSCHLHAGTIGIRTMLDRLDESRKMAATPGQHRSCDTFLNELIWREFYIQVLHHFPHVIQGAFRAEHDRLDWPGSTAHFHAWCAGMTGYPIVDAAMRCLKATGWMHNRLRMITAMFLTKDLLVHWQKGERYFMEQLVDGDQAANNGGWQWCAGTGTDASPWFRIFNPVTQGRKFDPEGRFVRQWVPELEAVSDRLVHEPWNDVDGSRRTGYPDPIVQHGEQREKCLAMFRKWKTEA